MGFPDAELSITLVSDSEIARLAGAFGRAPHPTDVLSFPLREGPGAEHRGPCLGDVVISIETADRHATAARHPLDTELRDLLIHGTLHLLGMDHARPPDRRAMRALAHHLRWELSRLR